MPKERTIEDIDKELEEEFLDEDGNFKTPVVEEPEEEETPVVEEPEEEETTEEKPEEEETPAEEEPEEEPDEDIEPVEDEPKQDKKEYAFEKYRKENQTLKQQAEADAALKEKFGAMAKQLGYESVDEFLAAYDDQTITKEAEEKNVDPEFYKKHKQMERELETTKAAQTKQEFDAKVNKFAGELDGMIAAEGLTEENKNQIIKELEADGYTLQDLVAIKNPKKFLRGYAAEAIAEKKVQAKLAKKKDEKVFEDERHGNGANITKDDIDSQIKKEMAEYARENNLHYN